MTPTTPACPGQLVLHAAEPLERRVVGVRHDKPDANNGQGCLCGCHWVVGLTGRIVVDRDTIPLRSLDPPLVVAAFDVPCPAGGPTREEHVAYERAEVGL